MELTLERFTYCLKSLNELLILDKNENISLIEFFDDEPEKPEYDPSNFALLNKIHLGAFTNLSVEIANVHGQITVLTETLAETTDEALKDRIYERINELSEYFKVIKENFKNSQDEHEKQRLADYDKYYNNSKIPFYEERLERWKTEKARWFPIFLKDEDYEKYYQEYLENPKSVIDRIIYSYQYEWMPFNPSLFLGIEYTRTITSSEKEAQCIRELLLSTGNTGRYEILVKYNMTIEELLNVSRITINPPYPIQNCNHEDEFESDPSQAFDLISNENLRYIIEITKLNYQSTLDGSYDRTEDVTFIFPDSETVKAIHFNNLHVFGIEERKIAVSSQRILEYIVKMLYTSKLDRYISIEDARELSLIFERWSLTSYVALCYLIPCIREKRDISLEQFISAVKKEQNEHEDNEESEGNENEENEDN